MDAAPADHAPNVHAVHRQRRQRAAVPMAERTQGIRSVSKLATKLGEIAGVVSVNMTDENVLAD